MTTIRDVAADAGVSVGTVSKVLNNLYVKPGNREKVEASIRKLDYRVNTYARGLKAQQTHTAAILIPDLINPFFAMLVNDVEQVLAAMGYRLLVCNSHNNADRELSYLNMARQNKVDGLIALTYSNLDEYLEAGLPVVSIDRHFSRQGICCVSGDNAEGGRLAARRFIETGCRKVVYIRNGSKPADRRGFPPLLWSWGRKPPSRRKRSEELRPFWRQTSETACVNMTEFLPAPMCMPL